MADYRHCGMGWPNGAVPGGNGTILSLPSPDLLMLGSEHWHYDEAVRAGKRVLFRGMARQGFRPSELKWDVPRYVDEITRDAVLASEPITDFVAWNELNLQDERGDRLSDFGNLTDLFAIVGAFQLGVIAELRRRPVTMRARIHFGAWAPKDETDYTQHWSRAVEAADVLDVHAYGPGAGIVEHIAKYRALFPGKPVQVTEWHSNGGDAEMDRDTLAMFANLASVDPEFRAYYFLWEWHNPPAHQRALADAIAVWGNGPRYQIFLDPPVVAHPDPPQPEVPVAPDPWRFWTAQAMAAATGCPQAAIAENWPRLNEQLWHCGLDDKPVHLAMLGTVAIETASRFEPIHEFRNADGSIPAVWYTYDGGPEYHGRGYIQLTHRYNYAEYGPKVAELWGTSPDQPDFNLAGEPDRALDPDISAAVAALYFRDHRRADGYGIPDAARDGDWREVRRLVQGGSAGLDRLIAIASGLGGTVPSGEERTYGVNVPDDVVLQRNAWSCAVRATYAALWAMHEQGQGQGVTYGDEGAADVYEWLVPTYDQPNVGLLDHTGAGLAEALRAHGYPARNVYPVSIDQVREAAGAVPVLLGGDGFDHWVYVRGRTSDNGLILENPSPGHMGISDYLRDSFGRLGPMAMVVIDGPQVQSQPIDYASLTGLAYAEDGVVVPALAAALANPDDANLRVQVDAVVRWLRANRPPA